MFETIIAQFLGLTGVAAFIVFAIGALKKFGVIKEDKVEVWVTGMQVLGLVALFAVKAILPLFGVEVPEDSILAANEILMTIANFGAGIIAFLIEIGITKGTYATVRGKPVIGFSYTLDRERNSGV